MQEIPCHSRTVLPNICERAGRLFNRIVNRRAAGCDEGLVGGVQVLISCMRGGLLHSVSL